jgi:hypothetical protein
MLPDPPIGTPSSVFKGETKKKFGTAPVLTMKLKSAWAVVVPAAALRVRS